MAQLAFLVVAAFLLTNKVWSPQFSLWLVPLAVLALPHRRILLAWMTIDALVWVPRMLYLYGEQNKGLPEQWFTTTVLLRDIAVVGAVRVGDPPDLPARVWIWSAGTGASTTRPAGRSTARPTRRRAWLPDRLGRRSLQLRRSHDRRGCAEAGRRADPTERRC